MSGSYLQSLGLNQVKPEHYTTYSAASSDDGLGDGGLDLFTNSTFDFLDTADFGIDTAAAATTAVTSAEETKVDLFAENIFGGLGDVVPGPFVGNASNNVGYGVMGLPACSAVQNTFGTAPSQFPMSPPATAAEVQYPPVVANAAAAPTAPVQPKGGRKKVAANPEAVSAAEEDKRRRNTAASARFRVKKKQHEQRLRDKTKELAEHAARLEERVRKLEMENELLRGLIIEKNGEGTASFVEGEMGFGA